SGDAVGAPRRARAQRICPRAHARRQASGGAARGVANPRRRQRSRGARGAGESASRARPRMSDVVEQFFALTPDRILDAVEFGGRRATGYALALNSLENRVYEVALEDETRIVAKFYRPGRWSKQAILDEHAFLAELHEAEIP